MEYAQKFIPEGWEECTKSFSLDELNKLSVSGEILQAKVTKCDSNYNLYLDLGNNITGVIPREEVEAVNIDETGFPKPNICISKVNKIVQFKVKDIKSIIQYIDNNLIKSRGVNENEENFICNYS